MTRGWRFHALGAADLEYNAPNLRRPKEEMMATDQLIAYFDCPAVSNDELNALFATAWPDYRPIDFAPVLNRSLGYVCAYAGPELVGFVNLAWDGGIHAFLLDTTVRGDWQRRGVGRQLVLRAAALAREQGVRWLHVDYEPHLDEFYRGCGFTPTLAGLIDLT